MPVAIALKFPTGRFHATPWGHHVNEGQVEWPPSPWRILRAIVACWKRKFRENTSLNATLPLALAALCDPPHYFLPTAGLGHTRHFMPLKFPDQGDRTKVFDAFITLSPEDEILVVWPNAQLNDDEALSLSTVLSAVNYFGRAESWCEARLLSADDPLPEMNCRPITGPDIPRGQEPIRVLVPDPATWDEWSFGRKILRPDPPWNLLAETADLHSERWSDPPGSRWVAYLRLNDCFRVNRRPGSIRSSNNSPNPTVARFIIDPIKGNVPPLVQDTVLVANQMRRVVMCIYDRLRRDESPGGSLPRKADRFSSEIFSGKDASGELLRNAHSHAYYIPTDEDGDGWIDHITVHASGGFGEGEVRAIDAMRRLRFGEGELSLLLVGLGRPDDFRKSPLFGRSEVWESVTPFLATRHPKSRGRKRDRPELLGTENRQNFLIEILREEWDRLAQRRGDLPSADHIEIVATNQIGPRRLRPLQFRRARPKPGDDGARRPALGFTLRFPEPIVGPLVLGHSSHFGLGLFLPSTDRTNLTLHK